MGTGSFYTLIFETHSVDSRPHYHPRLRAEWGQTSISTRAASNPSRLPLTLSHCPQKSFQVGKWVQDQPDRTPLIPVGNKASNVISQDLQVNASLNSTWMKIFSNYKPLSSHHLSPCWQKQARNGLFWPSVLGYSQPGQGSHGRGGNLRQLVLLHLQSERGRMLTLNFSFWFSRRPPGPLTAPPTLEWLFQSHWTESRKLLADFCDNLLACDSKSCQVNNQD